MRVVVLQAHVPDEKCCVGGRVVREEAGKLERMVVFMDDSEMVVCDE